MWQYRLISGGLIFQIWDLEIVLAYPQLLAGSEVYQNIACQL